MSLPKSGIIAVALIAAVAISLSVVSYAYASLNAQKLSEIATNEIKTNSNVQAHDLSKIIENKIDKVTAVLKTLATAPAIRNAEVPRSYDIIAIRQDSTKEITDGYFWLDKDGKLLYSSMFATNASLYNKYVGSDLGKEEYFIQPKNNGQTFFSNIIEAGDQKVPKLYISMPVIDTAVTTDGGNETIFKGIVATGIKTEVLADLVKADLAVPFQSEALILDKMGTVLYSTNASSVGTNVFTPEYRSYISSITSPNSKPAIDSLLSDLRQTKSGSQEIVFGQTVFTFSYSPVKVEGENFLMLYVYSPHNLTTEVNLLVDQQRNASAVIIAAIAAVAIGVGLLVISWNKRLETAVQDRTMELEKKSEQLLAHDKLQQEFINVAAHELRTPIQPLIGIIELIKQGLDGKATVEITQDEVNMLDRNAKRLERLSSSILEASRIESNTIKLNKEKVDMNEKIQNVIRDIKPSIPKDKKLDILFDSRVESGVPVYVEADKARLFEVLSNLLRNSIKFTNSGIIKVTLDKQDGSALISVSDTGEGIDPDIFPKLFTKFATRSDQGTGLGLYVSKGIIEAHGGKIWAENNSSEIGATITFTLPLMSSEAKPSNS